MDYESPLFISIFTRLFPGILLHIFLPTAVLIVPDAVKVVVISLSFQSFALLFINLSNSLVIVLLLMLPLCGMLFLMRFVHLPPWPPSESSLKPTSTPKHTHLSLDHSPCVPHGAWPLLCPWIQKFWWLLFVLLSLRVLLFGEIKRYKSDLMAIWIITKSSIHRHLYPRLLVIYKHTNVPHQLHIPPCRGLIKNILRGHGGVSGNTLTSHLWNLSLNPGLIPCGKAGSCLPLVGSLQYRFPLPFQRPITI